MAKKKQNDDLETSKSIAAQTQAFLAAGGKIDNVKKGVSGVTTTKGPKHIKLGN